MITVNGKEVALAVIALEIATGKMRRVPAMKFKEWDDFRWWLDYFRGYAL